MRINECILLFRKEGIKIMNQMMEKPLSFGEVLDATFRITKSSFSKLFMIMFIFLAPMYLFQAAILYFGGASIVFNRMDNYSIESFIERFEQGGYSEELLNVGVVGIILYFVFLLLLVLFSYPLGYASIIIAVDQIRKKEAIQIGSIIKRAFSRYWALIGGSVVYYLIIYGLFFGFAILITLYIGIISFISAASSPNPYLYIPLAIILFGGLLFILAYLLTRWSFYFPSIVFEKVSPGLTKSWNLTRGFFWRIVGLYIVLSILIIIFSFIFSVVIQLVLGNSILGTLLSNLTSILTMMITAIFYAVVYFDLRLRNEATDLKEMVESFHESKEKPPIEESIEDKSKDDPPTEPDETDSDGKRIP